MRKINCLYIFSSLALLSCGKSKSELHYQHDLEKVKKYVQLDSVSLHPTIPDTVSVNELWKDTLVIKPGHVTIGDKTYYVVESDILLSEQAYKSYLFMQDYLEKNKNTMLTGELVNGLLVKWTESSVISYCVNRSSFLTEAAYLMVKNNMAQATKDWENTCNVKFEYKPEFDKAGLMHGNSEVSFAVNYIHDYSTPLIASAFFPYDNFERRIMLITPQYFSTPISTTGILRHELGHVLGFRHEHIRGEAPTQCDKYGKETGEVSPLTKYDSKSVMHYLCGGVGSPDLLITPTDKEGAIAYYGPPVLP